MFKSYLENRFCIENRLKEEIFTMFAWRLKIRLFCTLENHKINFVKTVSKRFRTLK